MYVSSPFLQLDIYSKEKECSVPEDLSHELPNAKNIEKVGNHSDEAMQREEKQECGKEERGNNLVDLPPTKSWNLSPPSHCHSLLHEIKKSFFFSREQSWNNKWALWNIIKCKKKMQSVTRKENDIILEPTGKYSDLKRKIITYQMPIGERSHGQEELV